MHDRRPSPPFPQKIHTSALYPRETEEHPVVIVFFPRRRLQLQIERKTPPARKFLLLSGCSIPVADAEKVPPLTHVAGALRPKRAWLSGLARPGSPERFFFSCDDLKIQRQRAQRRFEFWAVEIPVGSQKGGY